MKEQIKKTLNQHKLAFILTWVLPLLCVVLGEAEVIENGQYQGNAQMEYILQSIGILLTIGLIPFALRIFSLNLVKRIQELPLTEALKSYQRWGEVRLFLIAVPALLNVQFYYLTLNTTGLFCAVMALIASLFCVPSENRLKNELNLPEEID